MHLIELKEARLTLWHQIVASTELDEFMTEFMMKKIIIREETYITDILEYFYKYILIIEIQIKIFINKILNRKLI